MTNQLPAEVQEIIALIENRPSRITLQKLAAETELSVSFVSKLVNGKARNPSIGSLTAIREYLKAVG